MASSSDSIIGVDLVVVDVDAAVKDVQENWGWILAEGMMQIVFGALAFTTPILSTAYIGLYTNAALVVTGLINMAGLLFAERGFKIRSFVLGIVQLLAGAVLEYYPLESLAMITTGIAALFMVDGLFRILLAEQNRDLPGWFWTLMSGVTSIFIGMYVLYNLPVSSLETIGTLVGINLMSSGSSRIKVGFLGRSLALEESKKKNQ